MEYCSTTNIQFSFRPIFSKRLSMILVCANSWFPRLGTSPKREGMAFRDWESMSISSCTASQDGGGWNREGNDTRFTRETWLFVPPATPTPTRPMPRPLGLFAGSIFEARGPTCSSTGWVFRRPTPSFRWESITNGWHFFALAVNLCWEGIPFHCSSRPLRAWSGS